MSSSSSSSQAIRGTISSTLMSSLVLANNRSIPVSGSVLAAKEDKNAEEAEMEGEGGADGGVGAL